MSTTFIEILSSPVSAVVYSSIGISFLSFLYGVYGIFLTFIQFLRTGPRKFFRRVERPAPSANAMDPIYGDHHMIKLKSSGISLHYVSKGVPNQPMILFIHGFPECWYSWRHQLTHFSKEYRVVAIDQRGYGLSSKPQFISDYRVETLAGDIADVIEQLGYEACILVGHDMGALVAWTTAMLYPHLVEKLIVMNFPHPIAFRQEFTLLQIHRSWFMFFDQTPYLPELSFQADDFAVFKESFHKKPNGLVNKDNIKDDDIEVFKYTFSQKGTTTAAINHYRALFRFQSDFSRSEIVAPVLLLWGCQGSRLDEQLANATQKYCGDIRIRKLPYASHWINQDVPSVVNKYIDLFLQENPVVEHAYEF